MFQLIKSFIITAIIIFLGPACKDGNGHITDPWYRPAPATTDPTILISNLKRSIDERDMELYASLLTSDFEFWELALDGGVFHHLNRNEELFTLEKLFLQVREVSSTFGDHLFEKNVKGNIVFQSRMLIKLKEAPNYWVDQVMWITMRQGNDDLWLIESWVAELQNDPNADIRDGFIPISWGELKTKFKPT